MRHVPLLAGIALLFFALLATSATVNLQSAAPFLAVDTSASAAKALSARIPTGQVATALRLGRTEGVAGNIRTGDTIDVYAFLPGGTAATKVLMRQKLVYAASQSPDATSLTLAMSPDEVVALEDALQKGARPYAVLRSGKGMSGGEAPDAFDATTLSSWVTRMAGAQ